MKKSKLIISISGGIYLSLVLLLSMKFPAVDLNLPLATASEFPQTAIAVILEHMRVALDGGYGIVPSILAISIAVLLYFQFDRLISSKYIISIPLSLLSILFGCMNVAGLCMYWQDCLLMFHSGIWMIGCILLAVGWALIFMILACLLFEYLDSEKLFRNEEVSKPGILGWIENHLFVFSFIIIMLGWLPWIVSYYPASMDNDVFDQLYAWFCQPRSHHPWFATTVLAAFYKIGAAVGNDNFGIFLFILCRDVMLAVIYASCVNLLQKNGFRSGVYYIVLGFYAITPVWGAYAKHAFKDTLAAGLFCLYIITMILVIKQIRNSKLDWKTCLLYGIAALLASMFRNNCIYAVLPATFLLSFGWIRYKQRLRFICLIFSCILCYFGYNGFIHNIQGVKPGSKAEIMSIPFQQTARTVRDYGSVLTEEEIYGISGIFEYEKMAEKYNPVISDPIKNECLIPQKDCRPGGISDYLKTWLQMMPKYPLSYMEAAVGQSYGYYAFTPNLPEKSGNWNSGMAIFDWIGCNSNYDEEFDFHYLDTFGTLRQILHAWAKVWDRIPVLCMTDICAIYTWANVLVFFYLTLKKRWLETIPIVAVGFLILTCVASPVNDCFRYFAPVAAAFPAVMLVIEKNGNSAMYEQSRET